MKQQQIPILPFGKGIAAIVLSSKDYNNKIKSVLSDSVYRILTMELTIRIERQRAFLIKKSDIPGEVAKKLIPHALVLPRLYRLPKIHKKRYTTVSPHPCISWQNISLVYCVHLFDRQPTTLRTLEAFIQKLNTINLYMMHAFC